jgi:uracil phosphoribosyltransferase
MNEFKNVVLLKHPLISHHLATIRDKNTKSDRFRQSSQQIFKFLIFEATKNLPVKTFQIETPLEPTEVEKINDEIKIVCVPILRAGLGISEIFEKLIPNVIVQHLGMYRNETTLKPVWYYNKIPDKLIDDPKKYYIYICDPMCATGNSSYEVIKLYAKDRNIPQENITFINLISCPVGMKKIFDEFPNIRMYTSAIDEKLNENGYIVPGLGDAGDRLFNTMY